MNFNAVKALLAPVSDERFEAWLRQRLGDQQHEDSVTVEEVGLDRVARQVVAERDSKDVKLARQPGPHLRRG